MRLRVVKKFRGNAGKHMTSQPERPRFRLLPTLLFYLSKVRNRNTVKQPLGAYNETGEFNFAF